jgi:hypothetical protein
VIAGIEELEVIAKIPAHIQKIAPDPQQAKLPLGARAPPTQAMLIRPQGEDSVWDVGPTQSPNCALG